MTIPKRLRDTLGLTTGDRLEAHVENNRIVLEPVQKRSSIEALYGRFRGADLLAGLEQEHREEIER